jgi:hypothetical protein
MMGCNRNVAFLVHSINSACPILVELKQQVRIDWTLDEVNACINVLQPVTVVLVRGHQSRTRDS